MATNLKLDDRLLAQALKASGKKTKRAAVTQALQEFIMKHKQKKILKFFGKIGFDPQYNYKAQRDRP